MDYEKTLWNIAKTIENFAKEIRRDGDFDPAKVNSFSKLITSYSSLLAQLDEEPQEWDYFQNGNPHYHDQLEASCLRESEERIRRREQEEQEEQKKLEKKKPRRKIIMRSLPRNVDLDFDQELRESSDDEEDIHEEKDNFPILNF